MMWYGPGMGGWGLGLMAVSMIVFWALVIAGIVLLVRYANGAPPSTTVTPHRPDPQRILAERYARGEIDDEEYLRRTTTLATGAAHSDGADG
ncbi:SHOCT domain-containing protein [Nocardia arizonensis]|uniref:SHOCT domain-containing protein n=1 Tax=Nocardia arizonensis TaxID=1141647 RepID=UPI000AF0C6D2|nr:SHOCT domain-containing protein [Nocardia arizonensis]